MQKSRQRIAAVLVCSLAAAAAPGQATWPADPELVPEMKKLIAWLDKGTPEQQILALDALRMSPPEAMAVMREALDQKTLKPETQEVLEGVYKDQSSARADIARWNVAAHEWETATVKAYDTCGSRNPAWDEAARTLLKAVWIEPVDPAERAAAVKTIFDAKCDDPYVLYWAEHERTDRVPVKRRMELLRKTLDSKWPGGAKLLIARASLWSGDGPWTEEEGKQVEELILATAGRMEELLQGGPTRKTVRELVIRQTEALVKIKECDAWTAYGEISEKVRGPIKAVYPAALECIEAAIHQITYRKLRGTGWAHTVEPDKWPEIQKHSSEAVACYQRALEIDPFNDVAAQGVLDCLLIADGDREKSLAAFYRALKCHPDTPRPAESLTLHLMKRWHGGEDSLPVMTHLARACALSRNFRVGIPQTVYHVLKYQRADMTPEQKQATITDLRLLVRYVFDTATVLTPNERTLGQAMNAHLMFGDVVRARNCMEKLDPRRADELGREAWAAQWDTLKERMNDPDLPAAGEANNRPDWLP